MKFLGILILTLCASLVMAFQLPIKTVTGKVESFDGKEVTLSGHGFTFKVPRRSIASKTKLERGATVTATFDEDPRKTPQYP
jgi:hypothetical protein